MKSRADIITSFYEQYDEDSRLQSSRFGQLEFITTLHYIHHFINPKSKILEIGAGTGKYSFILAKEGMDVTAFDLSEHNLKILKEKSTNLNIKTVRGDVIDLSQFRDNSFDATLVFGPMYHLFEPNEINRAIDEAIRVTKSNGPIFFSFISIYTIMYINYFRNNWSNGQKKNFTEDYKVKHPEECLFTGYDIVDFENLFKEKPVDYLTTVGTDNSLELAEMNPNFSISDNDFLEFAVWAMHFAEKRELLGNSSHLLYICKKK